MCAHGIFFGKFNDFDHSFKRKNKSSHQKFGEADVQGCLSMTIQIGGEVSAFGVWIGKIEFIQLKNFVTNKAGRVCSALDIG